ncbi:sensor histidine kinase [Dyadobacter endophyticus]|uniref:sensor histidine kinase n=1 Tax=Dyadobacter endophyticus TaxID=1749036 RepID=UPI003CEADC68
MKKYNSRLGALMATVVTVSILPVRLSEGQAANPVNLIGSETVIWLMCMSIWLVSYYTYYRPGLVTWQKLVVSLIFCAILSNLFYYCSNPFFEDYPLKPIRELPFWIAAIRLSLRGLLIGLIMVPIIFLLEIERQRQKEALQRATDRAIAAERQKYLLEIRVSERTAELEQTLSVLSKSQDELDHQVYLLTRIIASIAHDVNAPLKFIITGTKLTGDLIRDNQLQRADEYNQQLERALSNMGTFMQNLLEFAKGQIRKGALHLGNVNLVALIHEKAGLFEQILHSRGNTLRFSLDENLTVISNSNLLGVILHNLMDNAIKNTLDGEIEISGTVIDDWLHLCIQNPVPGEDRDEIPRTDQGYQFEADAGSSGRDSYGLGLILVRDISALLNVDFSLETAGGKVVARIIFAEFYDTEHGSDIDLSTTAIAR